MGFREVSVFEVKEVLRLWLRGEGLRAIERLAGVDRKTVRRYVAGAVEAGRFGPGLPDVATPSRPLRSRPRPAEPEKRFARARWAGHWAGSEAP